MRDEKQPFTILPLMWMFGRRLLTELVKWFRKELLFEAIYFTNCNLYLQVLESKEVQINVWKIQIKITANTLKPICISTFDFLLIKSDLACKWGERGAHPFRANLQMKIFKLGSINTCLGKKGMQCMFVWKGRVMCCYSKHKSYHYITLLQMKICYCC